MGPLRGPVRAAGSAGRLPAQGAVRAARTAQAESQAHTRDAASTAALDETERALGAWQDTWERFNQEASANAREADVQSSRIEHVEQVVQRLRARLTKLDDESQGGPAVPGDGDMAELALEIDEVGTRLGDVEARLEECIRALERTREELATRELALEEGRAGVQRLRHELASLEAVQQAALGRTAGVIDDWLKRAGLSAARRVGDALSVVAGWELAVEAVRKNFSSRRIARPHAAFRRDQGAAAKFALSG